MTLTPQQEKQAWEMSLKLKRMIDEDPVSFELTIPCMLAYWIRVSGGCVNELRESIIEQYKQQEPATDQEKPKLRLV